MRNYFLLLFVTYGSALSFATPMIGIILWAWVSMMNGHQLVFGFGRTLPLNMIAVALTALALLMRPGRKTPPMQSLTVFFLLFFVWCNITTLASLDPNIAWKRWDLSIKSMIFGFFVATVVTTRLRVRAMLWIFVISYGFYGVKGGGFTIITGGSGIVLGPPTSSISDRNQLALVLLMSLPLMNYLRATCKFKLVQIGLYAAMGLSAAAVIGSFSRGGLIGLIGMGSLLWWWSKNKFALILAAVGIAVVVFTVMPDTWFQRMNTIDTAAEQDASFMGRLAAWQFAVNAASSRLTGVGFSVTENPYVFNTYMQGTARAAHSIYFQVLGDHGFPGLLLFLSILALGWRTAGIIGAKKNANIPGLEWSVQLGPMLKVSLIGYAMSGAALSMAYDSSICAMVGLLIGTRYVVEQRQKEYARETAGKGGLRVPGQPIRPPASPQRPRGPYSRPGPARPAPTE